MANRTFIVGSKTLKKYNSLDSLEIYKDISMISTPDKKVNKNVNIKAVLNSIHNCFSWNLNERILLPEFGSDLKQYLYEGINSITSEAIIATIREIISKWEPRVQIVDIQNVSIVNDTDDNTIRLRIVYIIPSLDNNEKFYYTYTYNKNN